MSANRRWDTREILTLNRHGRHDDGRENDQQNVLHLATGRGAEVQRAPVEQVLDALDVGVGVRRVHLGQDAVDVARYVLAGLRLPQGGEIRVEERVRGRARFVRLCLKVPGEIIDIAIPDSPVSMMGELR